MCHVQRVTSHPDVELEALNKNCCYLGILWRQDDLSHTTKIHSKHLMLTSRGNVINLHSYLVQSFKC